MAGVFVQLGKKKKDFAVDKLEAKLRLRPMWGYA